MWDTWDDYIWIYCSYSYLNLFCASTQRGVGVILIWTSKLFGLVAMLILYNKSILDPGVNRDQWVYWNMSGHTMLSTRQQHFGHWSPSGPFRREVCDARICQHLLPCPLLSLYQGKRKKKRKRKRKPKLFSQIPVNGEGVFVISSLVANLFLVCLMKIW